MKSTSINLLNEFKLRNTDLSNCISDIEKSIELIINCYKNKGKILTCGNGGSASDSEHIVGELMKSFIFKRKLTNEEKEKIMSTVEDKQEGEYLCNHLEGALPAISLVSQSALNFAFINDVAADMVFAQQVFGYGQASDILIGLTTSGNSKNVVNATKVAKSLGMITIGFTGENESKLSKECTVTIKAPHAETYRVQEYHLQIYHLICAVVENEIFNLY